MPTNTPVATTEIPRVDLALTATGFKWSYDPSFSVSKITGRLQHRKGMVTEKKSVVKEYANMLKAGSIPPPICVTRDGMLVYGSHRTESAKLVGHLALPAIVIDVDGNGADEHVTNQLLSIAYAENRHGEKYSPADKQDAASHLLTLGYTNTAVQAELGLSPAQVSGIKREVDAQKRLDKLGIDDKKITRQVKRALSSPAARGLNDGPFKQLVALTKDANLTGTEVSSFAKDAKAAGSDIQADAVLSNVRNDFAQRIAEQKLGGASRPTPVGKLKGALKSVVSLCDASIQPITYKDHTATAADTIQMLDEAISCLQGIRQVQEDAAA